MVKPSSLNLSAVFLSGMITRSPVPFAFSPFVLFAPCHRVVEKNGGLGGFGAGKKLKKWLLHLEGVKI